jgi:molybdopterin synthase catalytic subunit
MVKQKSYTMNKIVAVKDTYKNINGVGKVKELTKGKTYDNIETTAYQHLAYKKSYLIITDLGERKRYYKMNMFIKEKKYIMLNRDKMISSLLD